MRLLYSIIKAGLPAGICVCLLGACTERRTASDPVPDGDTVEVVISHPQPEKTYKIIEAVADETPDSTTY